MSWYTLRKAKEEDCEHIMGLIRELAEYEKMPSHVNIDAEVLKRDGFGPEKFFECWVAEHSSQDRSSQGSPLIGFVLFYYIYSTWDGRACYMEDLYVSPAYRGKGVGTALWVECAKTALSKGCTRLQWAVLDWNKSAIEVYEKRGGINITGKEGWLLYRMTQPAMQNFVETQTAKSSPCSDAGDAKQS